MLISKTTFPFMGILLMVTTTKSIKLKEENLRLAVTVSTLAVEDDLRAKPAIWMYVGDDVEL